MELRELVRAIERGWLILFATALVGGAGGGLAVLLQPPTFVASAAVYVSTTSASNASDLFQGSTYTEQIVKSYANVATTPFILEPVIKQLDLHESATDLAKRVTAEAPVDTVVLQIAARASSARQSAAIANAVANQLSLRVARLSPADSGDSVAVKLTMIQEASVPPSPESPKPALYVVGALLGGLIIGCLLAVVRDRADTRIRDVASLRELSTDPVIGVTLYDPDTASSPNAMLERGKSVAAEAFRTVRTNIQYLGTRGNHQAFVISSSIASEGKSVSAVNIATAIAEAGQRVVLVDADLRRPKLAAYFGFIQEVGLSDVLIGNAEVEDVLQDVGSTSLVVLAAGHIPPNPNELLQSTAMAGLIEDLRSRYDVVIFDGPPLLPVSDSALLARATDGVVLAAAIGKVRRSQFQHALRSLEQVDANVLGVLATMVSRGAGRTTDAYGYRPEYTYQSRDDASA